MLITFFLVTLVIVLGAVCDLCAIAAGPDRRAALAARWRTSQPFLRGVFPRFRQQLADLLLWLGVVLLLAEDLVLLLFSQLFPGTSQTLLTTGWAGLLCLVVAGRMVCLPFSLRQLATLCPVFLLYMGPPAMLQSFFHFTFSLCP